MASPSQEPADAPDQPADLAVSALTFAVRCHRGQRRESGGGSFIEHPLEVARLLRDAGCSEVLVAAGLLHDVMAASRVSVDELNVRFGTGVADLVHAVTDHASTESYRRRKQVLREQVRSASGDAALLFAAENISEVRQLPHERYHEMRLEHYHESLGMLEYVAPGHALVRRLANELGERPTVLRERALGEAS